MAYDETTPGGIDASSTARITGVAVGTLNVWINRNLIPGVVVGTQGRARLFDLATVAHIAIMAVLVRLSYAAPFASLAAFQARNDGDKPGARLIIGPPRVLPGGRLSSVPTITFENAPSVEALDRILDRFADGRPESVTIVEVDRIVARVRKAFVDPDPLEKIQRKFGVLDEREEDA